MRGVIDLPISALEESKLKILLSAIRSGDWNKFKNCSDEPFENEKIVNECFRDAWELIDWDEFDFNLDARKRLDRKTGTTIIFVVFRNKDGKTNTNLMIETTETETSVRFRIWNIVAIPDFSGPFEDSPLQ